MPATEPDSQPLSTAAAIGLAGLTAAAVIGGGVFIAERGAPPRPAAPYAAAPRPTVVAAPPEAKEPPASAAATVTAATAAAPIASAAASIAPESLPAQLGYLTVRGRGEARVYVNGADLGPQNQALKVPCGLKYVRLGTAKEGSGPPSWLSPGQSVAIRCRAAVEIAGVGPR